jgi:hypothetical protein
MTSEATSVYRKGTVAVVLLIAGVLCLGIWRVLSGSEHQAFAKGATPPTSSAVTSGHSYSLAVPGGVPAMVSHGISEIVSNGAQVLALTCEWSLGNGPTQSLAVSTEAIGTKAETTVAHFVAPVSGKISVTCDGWGKMFVPDADSGSGDPSGLFLLLSIAALTAGGALALSAGYTGSGMQRSQAQRSAPREDAAE